MRCSPQEFIIGVVMIIGGLTAFVRWVEGLPMPQPEDPGPRPPPPQGSGGNKTRYFYANIPPHGRWVDQPISPPPPRLKRKPRSPCSSTKEAASV